MFRYLLGRFLCVMMSFLLAVSVAGAIAGGLTVGLTKSESFIQRNCEQFSDAFIADIDAAAADAAAAAGLPEDALVGAVNSDNFGVVSAEIARMFSYRYTADYTDCTAIYNLFYEKLSDYANRNTLGLTEEQLAGDASLAVNYLNFRLAGNDSTGVKLFNLATDKKALYAFIFCAVGLVVSVVALELLNDGRHRKFSFIGMGLMIAGYELVLVPLALRYTGVLEKIRFCVYTPYDDMVRQCHYALMSWVVLEGIPLIVIGLALLVLNYRYYAEKLKRVRASRENFEKNKEDYMDAPKAPRPRKEGEELERHVMKIDFEE